MEEPDLIGKMPDEDGAPDEIANTADEGVSATKKIALTSIGDVVGLGALVGAAWCITKKSAGDPKTGRTVAPTPAPTHPPTNAAIPCKVPT